METWTSAWRRGPVHGGVDQCMEAWTNAWRRGPVHGGVDQCMEAWTSAQSSHIGMHSLAFS